MKSYRIAAATLGAVMAVSLTACSSGSGGGTANGAALTKDDLKGKTISFIPGVGGDSFYLTMKCGIESEAAKYGMKVDYQAPQKFDASQQIPIVNAATATNPAAMLIAPTDSKALQAPLIQANSNGIKIGLVDTTLSDTSVASTGVSTDNEQAGAAAADSLAKLIDNKGTVLVISFQSGASTSDARTKGFEDEIKKYPNIVDLGAQVNDNDPAKAASIVSATIAAHPDLNGIFATNQFAAEGAGTGLRNAGAAGKVKVVGFDAGAVQVQQLQQGVVQALIAQQPSTIGVDAVDNIVAALTGGTPKKQIGTGSVEITKGNLDTPQVQAALYKTTCS